MNEVGYHFFLEPGTGEPHIWKHHVTEREAIEAVEHQMERKRSRRDSYVVIGKTESGRILKVVLVAKPNHIFIVTG